MCCLECLIGDWAVTTVSTHAVGVFLVLPLCSLHASAFGFVKAQFFFVTAGEPGRASFSTDGVDCRCCRCYVSEAQPLRSLYLL